MTYHVDVAGNRATLSLTFETNAVTRLDAWPRPWTLVRRVTFTGSFATVGDVAELRLENTDNKLVLELTCKPRTWQVLGSDARLIAKSEQPGACHADPTATWVPAEKTAVTGLSCVRDGDEEDTLAAAGVDMAPIELVEGLGIEWVQEDNGCFASGQGFRRRAR